MIGLFGTSAIGGVNGLLYGGGGVLLLHQTIAVLASGAYSFAASWILAKIVDKAMGLRVTPDQVGSEGKRIGHKYPDEADALLW